MQKDDDEEDPQHPMGLFGKLPSELIEYILWLLEGERGRKIYSLGELATLPLRATSKRFKDLLDHRYGGSFPARVKLVKNLHKLVDTKSLSFDKFDVHFGLHTIGDVHHFTALAALFSRRKLSYGTKDLTEKSSGLTSDQLLGYLDAVASAGLLEGEFKTQTQAVGSQHVAGRATRMIADVLEGNSKLVTDFLRMSILSAAPQLSEGQIAFHKNKFQGLGESGQLGRKKVLIWARKAAKSKPDTRYRNSTAWFMREIRDLVLGLGLTPVMIGEKHVSKKDYVQQAVDLREFYKDPAFQGQDTVLKQLRYLDTLRYLPQKEGEVVAQIGVKTGGMDGPALMGLPTIVLDLEPSSEFRERMSTWVGKLANYHIFYPLWSVPESVLNPPSEPVKSGKPPEPSTSRKPPQRSRKKEKEREKEIYDEGESFAPVVPFKGQMKPKLALGIGKWMAEDQPDYENKPKYPQYSDDWKKDAAALLKHYAKS